MNERDKASTDAGVPCAAFAAQPEFRVSGPGLPVRLRPRCALSSLFYCCLSTLLLLLLAAGCGSKPESLLQKALKAESEARLAFEKHDPAAADLAAARAEDATQKLQRLADAGKLRHPTSRNLLNEAKAAAGSARNYAELAHEELQRRQRLATLKLKTYQELRASVFGHTLGVLAPVADHLARSDTNSLSAAEQKLASLAWNLVQLAGHGQPSTNDAPDWTAVAADLRSWTNGPPPGVAMALALGFAVGGMKDFALCELETLDAAQLTGTNARSLYHLERCALFALNGWDRSAARELDQALQLSPNGWGGVGSTQAVALCSSWLAGQALQKKDFRRADLEIARALKTWPGSPLTPFLATEQQAALGEWAPAADALERQAKLTQNEWLAGRLTRRARQLRQTKGSAPTLLCEPAFMLEAVLHALSESAGDTAALKKLEQLTAAARALGERMTPKPIE